MARQFLPVLIFMFVMTALGTSCSTFPQYYLRFEQPHKDVARIVVHVPTRLDATGYRRIVETELQRVFEACGTPALPIYEVRFDFVVPTDESQREEKVATYSWTMSGVASNPVAAEEHTLILY
jgi:hypothetical protein